MKIIDTSTLDNVMKIGLIEELVKELEEDGIPIRCFDNPIRFIHEFHMTDGKVFYFTRGIKSGKWRNLNDDVQ